MTFNYDFVIDDDRRYHIESEWRIDVISNGGELEIAEKHLEHVWVKFDLGKLPVNFAGHWTDLENELKPLLDDELLLRMAHEEWATCRREVA